MKKILFLLLVFTSFSFSQRLVVLEPSIIEIIYKLGAQNQIVGIAKMMRSKIYPSEKTDKLTSVGNYAKPSIEKIIALKPDLVVVNRYSSNTQDDLKRFGIKTTTFSSNSIEDIYKNITEVGKIVNKQKEATALIKDLKHRLSKINKTHLKGKKAVFFYSSAPLMAFNHKTLPGDILKFLGLTNLSDNLKGDRPILSQEYLLSQNPDFILTIKGMGSSEDILDVNPLLKRTNAGKNRAIYFVPSSEYLRGTYRIVDAIEKLYEMLSNERQSKNAI